MSAPTRNMVTAPCTEGPRLVLRVSCACSATWWCAEEGLAMATEMLERHQETCAK